jgi:hypothetical protein
VFNHFYGGGNNWKENHDPPQATVVSGLHWKDKICVGNVPDCDQNLVKFTFSNGYSQWGGDANNGSENLIKSFADDITIVRGRHTLKAGGQAQFAYYNGFGRQCVAGCINFDFKNTGRPGDTNFTTAGGSPLASMLLGYAQAGSIDTIRYIGQQWPSFSGFVQDDWRMRSNLVVNLGLRWETTLPPTGEKDNWSDFDPNLPNPGAGGLKGALIYAGSGTGLVGSRRLADSYFKAFGPRLTSYSLSYANISTVTGSTHNLGFTLTDTQSDSTNGLQPRFLVKDGRPAYVAPPFVDPSFGNGRNMPWFQGEEATRPPAYQSFNLSIQHQITSSSTTAAWEGRRRPAAIQRARPEVRRSTVRRRGARVSIPGCRGGLYVAVPRVHQPLGIERYRTSGAAPLPAIPGNRHGGGRWRSQWPLHLSRRHDPL